MLCQLEAQVSLTGFRTNKRYAILLEFFALKWAFVCRVIPFSSAINVLSTRNAALE